MWSKLKQCRGRKADHNAAKKYFSVKLPYPAIVLCPHIIADNGLAAENDADNKIDHNGKDFAFNADDRNRNINAIL